MYPTLTLRQLGTNLTTGPFGTVLSAAEYVDDGIPLVNPTHISNGRIVPDGRAAIGPATASRLRRHALRVGDLVMGRKGEVGRTALVGPREEGWICGSDSIAVRTDPSRLVPGFLRWIMASPLTLQSLEAYSAGATVDGINEGILLRMPVPVPAVAIQGAVAGYLDAETARIDGLVDGYRGLAGSLLGQRAAVTSAGAAGESIPGTRKRSSLQWLCEVPAHWNEVKLTLLARLGSGHTPSRENADWWTDCTIPWVTTGEVWQIRDDRSEYLYETREMISQLGLANSSAELCPAGTVVLSRTASAGFSAIMGRDMATSQDYMTWTCGPRLRPRYLLLCLRAMRPDLLGRLAMGSTHQTIYVPDIQSIRIPVPPVDEQDQIVEWVWSRLGRIDSVVDAIGRQIELLSERRQALITAAVTGQIEIPGAVA
jgi:type I restriction enzyme, S subunit